MTDWLDQARSEIAAPSAATSEEESGDSLGDWLSNLPRGEVPSAPAEPSDTFRESIDLPDWMKPAVETSPAPKQETSEPSLPDWMKPADEPSPAPAKKTDAPFTPDWMASFREQEPSAESGSRLTEPASEFPSAPAFVSGTESLGNQADELFSIDMPEWLSNIAPTEQKPAPAVTQEEISQEAIAPADLPSWVQAMRPVESVLPSRGCDAPAGRGDVGGKRPAGRFARRFAAGRTDPARQAQSPGHSFAGQRGPAGRRVPARTNAGRGNTGRAHCAAAGVWFPSVSCAGSSRHY